MTPGHNQGESHSLIGSLPKFPVSIGGFQGVQGCFSDKLIVGKSPHLCRKKIYSILIPYSRIKWHLNLWIHKPFKGILLDYKFNRLADQVKLLRCFHFWGYFLSDKIRWQDWVGRGSDKAICSLMNIEYGNKARRKTILLRLTQDF